MDTKNLLTKIYLEGEIPSDEIELKDDKIIWTDAFGAENYISKFDIATNGEFYAWYETNDVGNDKVKIKLKDNFILVWTVPVNSMGFSWGGCNFFQLYEKFLIVSYHDKHHDILNFIDLNNFDVRKYVFDGYRKTIEMNSNEIFINELFENSDVNTYKLTIIENEIIKEMIPK